MALEAISNSSNREKSLLRSQACLARCGRVARGIDGDGGRKGVECYGEKSTKTRKSTRFTAKTGNRGLAEQRATRVRCERAAARAPNYTWSFKARVNAVFTCAGGSHVG